MERHRSGVSAVLGLLALVIIVGAAFFIAIPMAGSQPTATSSTQTTSQTTSSTGGSTSTTSTPTASTGTLTMNIKQPLIVAPDAPESVAMTFVAVGTVVGNYSLSATGLPSGVTASFKPAVVNLPTQLTTQVTMTLKAANGTNSITNSTMNVQAAAGSSVYKSQFPIMSVEALVFIQGNAFSPSSLTVTAGTKVYWINLDAVGGEAGGTSGQPHDVTALDKSFSSGNGDLQQYDIFGYTFTSAGTVNYDSQAQGTSVSGQIIVTG